jgi:hypothetical protein
LAIKANLFQHPRLMRTEYRGPVPPREPEPISSNPISWLGRSDDAPIT